VFTGIVKGIGTITSLNDGHGGRRLAVDTAGLATADWRIGDSVAVSGVCLTRSRSIDSKRTCPPRHCDARPWVAWFLARRSISNRQHGSIPRSGGT
jgi:hypothetical protein